MAGCLKELSMLVMALLPHKSLVRAWATSGALELFHLRGHIVHVAMRSSDWLDVPASIQKDLHFLPLDSLGGGRLRGRVRAALRLGSMVTREENSPTYAHKLGQWRPLLARAEIAAWRRFRRRVPGGVDGGAMEERLRGLEARFRPRSEALGLIRDLRPDVLLWATLGHQDNDELEVVKACRAEGVPIVLAWGSWDSASSKGGNLVRPDRMLVWGEESARHAADWHNCPAGQILVTGPVHWDPYAEPQREPVGKPSILVAGTSINFWEDEYACLKMLGRDGLEKGYRVLYRPHPRGAWGWHPRDMMPEGVVLDGITAAQVWGGRSGWSLHPDDLAGYPALIASVRCVVAAFSTMTIEAALLGKTPIMVGYGRTRHGPGMAHVHQHYLHMRHVVAWAGVKIASEADDLLRFVRHAVEGHYAEDAPGLRQMALRVARVDGHARQRAAEALEALTSSTRLKSGDSNYATEDRRRT